MDRAIFALSASRSQALSMLVALRLTQQAAHRLSQQREYPTNGIGACVTMQKQNVELVVQGGAVAAVVPLLSHFPVSEHDSSSRSIAYT